MIEMRIVGVRVEMPTQQPILMLTEVDGPRSLPILIGSAEATAIAMHQQGVRPARPLTHDLLGHVITALGRSVVQVRVVDFREGTFFGELAFDDGTTVSARPVDAIALAVRVEIPVFVEEAVLAEAGIVVPPRRTTERGRTTTRTTGTPRTRSNGSASSWTRCRPTTSAASRSRNGPCTGRCPERRLSDHR